MASVADSTDCDLNETDCDLKEADCYFGDSIDASLRKQWLQEQKLVCNSVILKDCELWQKERVIAENDEDDEDESGDDSDELVTTSSVLVSELETLSLVHRKPDDFVSASLKYVAGFDISFVKDSETMACAALVICELPDLQVVYEELKMIEITVPYVAGFLCFREAPFAVEAFATLREKEVPFPQVLLIDGNGYLHNRGAGLACYIGVKLDMPTVGVSKNLFHFDDIRKDCKHTEQINSLKQTGDSFPLFSKDGEIVGMALKSCPEAHKPVYVSVGHRISIDTAAWVVRVCSKHRVPEPIRQADIRSRQYLREKAMLEISTDYIEPHTKAAC